jgi:hypothetical protein
MISFLLLLIIILSSLSTQYSLYAVSNAGIAVGLIVWLDVQHVARNQGTPIANSGLYFAIVSGVIYGVMMAFLVYYGWRVYRIRLRARSRSLRHPFSTSTAMASLTVAVFLVVIVKPISAFQSDVLDLPDTSPDSITLSNFFLVFLCEILPIATILMVFRAVPSSRRTRCTICCRSNQSLEELEETLTRQQSHQQWSSSNSQEYWDRRRKSDVLGGDVRNHRQQQEQQGKQELQEEQKEQGEQQWDSGVYYSINDTRHIDTRTLADEEDDIENTRGLYDSDSESSPFARARERGSTPGTPLFLPQQYPIEGSSPSRGIGPRDLLQLT